MPKHTIIATSKVRNAIKHALVSDRSLTGTSRVQTSVLSRARHVPTHSLMSEHHHHLPNFWKATE